MGFGKITSLIAAVVALLSIFLGFILPELFSWYKFEASSAAVSYGFYLTGFGTTTAIDSVNPISEIAILELIGGISVILGVVACVVGITKEEKKFGFLGGILMLLGPILLLTDFLIVLSEFADYIDFYQINPDSNMFWDSVDIMAYTYTWNLWIGFFMAGAAGVLGLIGGLTL
jgi:hypothetical protein